MPRPGSTWAAGSAASRGPGSLSLDPRIPDPITTEPVLATASSTRTGQSRLHYEWLQRPENAAINRTFGGGASGAAEPLVYSRDPAIPAQRSFHTT